MAKKENRTVLVAALLALLIAPHGANAQQVDDQIRSELRRGATKIWIGTALIAAGALIIPVTATNAEHISNNAAVTAGVGTMGAGTWLVWSGFQQQRHTVRPYIGIGLVVGHRKALIISRGW